MKIEIGYYRMRDGRKARVLCTDAPGIKPVVILVEALDGSDSYCDWVYADGKYHSNGIESSRDLIEPWREPVKYNVDVWLKDHPTIGPDVPGVTIIEALFGRPPGRFCWNRTPGLSCDKHYRITVEEVMP